MSSMVSRDKDDEDDEQRVSDCETVMDGGDETADDRHRLTRTEECVLRLTKTK